MSNVSKFMGLAKERAEEYMRRVERGEAPPPPTPLTVEEYLEKARRDEGISAPIGDGFDLSHMPPKVREDYAGMIQRIEAYLDAPQSRGLVILGANYGTGKTRLARAVAATMKHIVVATDMRGPVGHTVVGGQEIKLSAVFTPNFDGVRGLLSGLRLKSAPQVVVLDDLGAEAPINYDPDGQKREARYTTLFDLLYEAPTAPTVVVTTNLDSPQAIRSHIGGRAFNRLEALVPKGGFFSIPAETPSYRSAVEGGRG